MRIAVQNPVCVFGDQARNFNGYNFKFIEKYCDVIYVRGLHHINSYRKRLKELGWTEKKLCISAAALNRAADVLVCFNGCAFARSCRPPKAFKGLKIYHVMDYSNRTSDLNRSLERGNVEYLMGYCRHDLHSGFFQKFFPSYLGKVIAVPFGYSHRFVDHTPFGQRINKCIALGSVNPVNDPLMDTGALRDYVEYYHDRAFSHEIRKQIVDHLDEWSQYFDSRLPVFPETKNPKYDAVEELNHYTMFINDECIDNYPPARTYEGIACGAVMVCTDSSIYAELGFRDGVNCVMFRKGDYDDMLAKIGYYMEHPAELKAIQEKSLELSRRFTHEQVADRLYDDIQRIRK